MALFLVQWPRSMLLRVYRYLLCQQLSITFSSGEKNSCYLPESTFKTFNLAKEAHPTQEYTWIQIPGYGHLDCIYGKAAVHDVYPYILKALDPYAQDDLHLDKVACHSVVKAVTSLKSKICESYANCLSFSLFTFTLTLQKEFCMIVHTLVF